LKYLNRIMVKIANKYWSFYIYLALALGTFVVFRPVHSFDFVNYDDNIYITENLHIKTGLTLSGIIRAFTSPHAGMWHPLTTLSHMLDCELFGLNPLGHHLTNLFFHIANTMLLFWVLKRMTGAIWPSAFVAAVFALHPLNVESVAWVSERKNVLSTFFWLLTMAAYTRYVKCPSVGRYLLILFVFALGLMAKPMLVTLPFVLLLLDYWPFGRLQRKTLSSLAWEKIPFFALSILLSIVTFVVQRSAGVMGQAVNLNYRIANALVSYVRYVGKMVWPSRLAVFYPYPGAALPIWQVVAAVIFLIFVSVCVIGLLRNRRYPAVGWLWYLGTLVPVIGLVQVGGQAMADRYAYVPLIGIFIMVAWGLNDLFAKWRYRRPAFAASALMVLLVLAVCTVLQLSYWRNSITLFEHAIAVTSGNYIAHNGLAKPLYQQGRLDEAIAHYTESLRINPNFADTHIGLGIVLYERGQTDEAFLHFTRALQLDPNSPSAHFNLGVAFARQGKIDQAATHFTQALRIAPEFGIVYDKVAHAFIQQGKLEQAITLCHKAIRMLPAEPAVYNELVIALALQGEYDQAVMYFTTSLRIAPQQPEMMNDFAWLLATSDKSSAQNRAEAVKFAGRACELTDYKYPGMLDTLAAAYAAAGRFGEALETAEKALKLAEVADKKELAGQIQARLQLYKAGQPYIEK
jgi:tetratricopeptide (TPR) repeat protein